MVLFYYLVNTINALPHPVRYEKNCYRNSFIAFTVFLINLNQDYSLLFLKRSAIELAIHKKSRNVL